jgi:predicted enzyme related to lactoylglutathione lyase
MHSLNSRIAFLHFSAADTKKAAQLYSAFFGIQFAKTGHDSYRAPIASDGCTAVITPPYRGNEGLTVYLAVEDLAKAVAEIKGAGGSVTVAEFDIHDVTSKQLISKQCEVVDPFGNHFGLVQISPAVNSAMKTAEHVGKVDSDDYAAHLTALHP